MREGAYPVGGNRFGSPSGDWVPLYVGRMIHQFDHRAASVEANTENLHNAALSGNISAEQKVDPFFVPTPQYWVPASEVSFPAGVDWTIAFRDIARATDARTTIAAAVPKVGLGNKVPAIFTEDVDNHQSNAALLLGNLGTIVFDFVIRQKSRARTSTGTSSSNSPSSRWIATILAALARRRPVRLCARRCWN